MSKILALYKNEMFKLFRKSSVIVGFIVLFVMVGGCGVLTKISERRDIPYEYFYYEDYEGSIKNLNGEIERTEKNIEACENELRAMIDNNSEYEQINNSLSSWIEMMQSLNRYRVDLAYFSVLNENRQAASDYRRRILDDFYYSLNYDLGYLPETVDVNKVCDGSQRKEYSLAADEIIEKINSYSDLMKTGDINSYIELCISKMEKEETDDYRKKVYTETYRKIAASRKISSYNVDQVIELANRFIMYSCRIHNAEIAKESNPESISNIPDFEMEKMITESAMLLYDIENDITAQNNLNPGEKYNSNNSEKNMQAMTTLGIVITVVFLIMTAGAAISHEISTGSVKSLIIAPVKRGKIFFSKVLMIFTYALILTALNLLVSVGLGGILFGFDSVGRVITVSWSGRISSMNFITALILTTFLEMIPALLFAYFGLMLSSVTKNTALSVTAPLGLFLAGVFIDGVLADAFAENRFILSLIPTQNVKTLHFTEDVSLIFTGGSFITGSSSGGFSTPLFSVIYLIIIFACILLTARDKFTRRDIL